MKKCYYPACLKSRCVAYGLDLMVEYLLSLIFVISANTFFASGNTKMAWFQILCLLIMFAYLFIFFPYKNSGQTIGKKLFKIKTVDENYQEVKLSKTIIREYLIKYVFAFFFIVVIGIEIIFNFFAKKTNNLVHDRVLRTIVIDKK